MLLAQQGSNPNPTNDSAETRAPRLRRLAAGFAIAAIVQTAAVAWLLLYGDHRFEINASPDSGVRPLGVDLLTAGVVGIAVLFPLIGALILQRRPFISVPWLMISLGLGLGLAMLTAAYGVNGMPPNRPLPFALVSVAVSQLLILPSIGVATVLLLLLFPNDRLAGPRWRFAAWLAIAAGTIGDIALLIRPGELYTGLPGVRNPIGLQPYLADVDFNVITTSVLALTVALVLAAASLVVRYRRADPIEAAQIRWIALFAILAAAGFSLTVVSSGVVGGLGFGLGVVFIACMPIAIGIAITRYHLYDIDRLINRAIVYGSLSAILAGIFTAGVGLAQRLFVALTDERSDAAIVATTLVVATLYAPLRKRLDAIVDRRFKYEHSRFGTYREELQKTLSLVDARAAAERLAKEIGRETGATDVVVLDSSGAPSATVGSGPIGEPFSIPIPGGHGALSVIVLDGAGMARRIEEHRRDIEEIAGLAARALRRSEGR